MEHDVHRLKDVTPCVLDHREVHEVLKTILLGLTLILTVLVDLDDGAIDDKGTVVGQGLETLPVVSVAELYIEVLIETTLFVLPSFLLCVKLVNVLEIILLVVFASAVFVVTEVAIFLAVHGDISTITNDLALQPRVISSQFTIRLKR